MSSATKDKDQVPPAVQSAPPEKELERKLQNNPDCEDAKADALNRNVAAWIEREMARINGSAASPP